MMSPESAADSTGATGRKRNGERMHFYDDDWGAGLRSDLTHFMSMSVLGTGKRFK